jgi:hypothetical protein
MGPARHAGCYRQGPRLGRTPLKGMRSGGRVVEGARLESEYTPKAYRGFESLPLRQILTSQRTIVNRHGRVRSSETHAFHRVSVETLLV